MPELIQLQRATGYPKEFEYCLFQGKEKEVMDQFRKKYPAFMPEHVYVWNNSYYFPMAYRNQF